MAQNTLWLVEAHFMQQILASAVLPECLQKVEAGDFIALKTVHFSPQQPLENCLSIQKIGQVQAKNDFNIAWKSDFTPKLWRHYINRSDVWQVSGQNWMDQALMDFVLRDQVQDTAAFLAAAYWQKPDFDLRFAWTEFYRNIAQALLAYQQQRQSLLRFVLKLAERYQLTYLCGKALTDICPFTVMGLFNRGISTPKRQAIAQDLADFLKLHSTAPESFDGIPILNNQSSCFFAFNNNHQNNDINQLWQFFATAIAYTQNETTDLKRKFIQQYDRVSQQHAVGWNLSMGLFWLAPYQFVSLDSQSQQYIQKDLGFHIAKQGAKGRCSGQDYLNILLKLEHNFQMPYSLARNFPELALYAWEQQGGLKSLANDNDEDLSEVKHHLEDLPVQSYSLEHIIAEGCFLDLLQLQQLEQRLLNKKNLILQGPSGTGKTWLAKRLADAVVGHKSQGHVHMTQFHANTSYEDFIRGWRPLANVQGQNELQLVDGPFLALVQKAHQYPNDRFVMVIEEINRGQTAHIFGELLTLLESSKRQPQDALSLTYAKAQEKVYIPDNVYLVATMNRADRSLMPLDFALKRRFAFATLTPKFNQAWVEHGLKHGLSLALLEMIQEKIQQLNQEIAENRYLGQGLVLGHSYFTPRQKIYDEKNWYQDVIESEVLPLLEDYCADDAMQLDKWQTDLLDLQ